MGFGGAGLGGLYRPVSDRDAHDTLLAAYRQGLRFFDTAPQYGLGRSEERVGRAIEAIGRANIVLSTKVGRLLLDCAADEVTSESFVDVPQRRIVYDYSYDGVLRSYEASRQRLGVANVDILLVHDVCVFTHGSQAASDTKVRELFDGGGYRALEELREAGEIMAIGAGVNEWQVCETLLGLGDFDCFLLAGRYTLLEQEALDSFLPLCVKRDVGIVLGGPFNSGILATGPIDGARYNYKPAPPEVVEKVRRIQAVCDAHRVPLVFAALRFVFGHPAVRTVIPGAVSPAELTANVEAMAADVPDALWRDLKTAGLVRPDAPVPGDA